MHNDIHNPIALCPLTTKVTAVYLIDDNSLERWPVLALALYANSETMENTIEFIESDRAGLIDNPEDSENFLGYEFDLKQQNWEDEIASLKKRRKEKAEKNSR